MGWGSVCSVRRLLCLVVRALAGAVPCPPPRGTGSGHPSLPTMPFLLWERFCFASIGERYFRVGFFLSCGCLYMVVGTCVGRVETGASPV